MEKTERGFIKGTIADAREALLRGECVNRATWVDGYDAGMARTGGDFIQLVRNVTAIGASIVEYRIDQFIMMQTHDGKLVPWQPSSVDILADDWQSITH